MNIQTGVRSLLVSLVAVGLTACGAKVDCNSDAVKRDALEIIQSHLNKAVWYNEMKMAITGDPKLENIKTVDADKNGKQAQCKGAYSLTYNEKQRSTDFIYNLAYLEDKGNTEVRVVVQDVQGGLMGLAMSERPIKNGEEKIYDIYNNNLISVRHWNKGREDGRQEYYNRNNKTLVHQYDAVDGTKVGSEKRWSSDGTLITDLVWTNGKATGFMFTRGDTASIDNVTPYTITALKDGLKDGPQKTYSSSHNGIYVNIVANFKEGKQDGTTQHFNDRGEAIFEVLYSQDSLVLDDATTARSLNACVEGHMARYLENGMGRYDNDAMRESKRRDYQLGCQNGRLP